MSGDQLTEQDWARVLHAARMMVELPRWAFDPALDQYVQHGCRESFGMNVRKLIEFLIESPGSGGRRRMTAQDLLPGWKRPAGNWATRQRLRWAARVVAHLAYDDQMMTPTDRGEFEAVADEITAELERFARDLSAAEHPAGRYFTDQLRVHVRPRLP